MSMKFKKKINHNVGYRSNQFSHQIGKALGPDPQSSINILRFLKEAQLYNLI